jgi:hypothetical protein
MVFGCANVNVRTQNHSFFLKATSIQFTTVFFADTLVFELYRIPTLSGYHQYVPSQHLTFSHPKSTLPVPSKQNNSHPTVPPPLYCRICREPHYGIRDCFRQLTNLELGMRVMAEDIGRVQRGFQQRVYRRGRKQRNRERKKEKDAREKMEAEKADELKIKEEKGHKEMVVKKEKQKVEETMIKVEEKIVRIKKEPEYN